MVHLFQLGEKRYVWPRPGHMVPDGPDSTIFLPKEGKEVIWSDYWHKTAQSGSLCFTDPTENHRSWGHSHLLHSLGHEKDSSHQKTPESKADKAKGDSTSKAPASAPVKGE